MRFSDKLKNFDIFLASFALATLLVTIILQVFLRFLFSKPLMGAEEFTRYMVIFIVTAPLAFTERTKSHVVMEEIQEFIPRPLRSALRVLIDIVTTIAYGIVTYSSISVLVNNAKNTTATLLMPFWLFFLPTVVGFVSLTIVRIAALIRRLRKGD